MYCERLSRESRRSQGKKLAEAALHWVRGAPKKEAQSDLEAFGAPRELIDDVNRADDQEIFDVFPENWTAVEMFTRLATQFHWSGMGGATGLNYQSVDFLFKLFKIKKRDVVFDQIRIMEIAALKHFNEKEA